MKLRSVAKAWSNNPVDTPPRGLTGLVVSVVGSKAWGEGGLSTVVTPTVEACIGGELEGGELSRPFFFFFGTGLNGVPDEAPPAVSIPSQTIQQRKTVVTVNPLKVTSILALLGTLANI